MKELKEYFEIIRGEKKLFFSIWSFFLLLGVLVFLFKPTTYLTSISVDVTRKPSEAKTDFDYDKYYYFQANDSFANLVISWIKDPVFIDKVVSSKNLQPEEGVRADENFFVVKKQAPTHFVLEFQTNKVTQSIKICNAIEETLNKKIAITRREESPNWFELVITGPVIKSQETGIKTILITAVAGLFFAFFGALFYHYWKKASK